MFHAHGKQNDRAASLLFDLRVVKKKSYFKAINIFRFQHQKVKAFYFFRLLKGIYINKIIFSSFYRKWLPGITDGE